MYIYGNEIGFWLVSSPDPTDAAADGLHHRYASVGSGETGNKIVARGMPKLTISHTHVTSIRR